RSAQQARDETLDVVAVHVATAVEVGAADSDGVVAAADGGVKHVGREKRLGESPHVLCEENAVEVQVAADVPVAGFAAPLRRAIPIVALICPIAGAAVGGIGRDDAAIQQDAGALRAGAWVGRAGRPVSDIASAEARAGAGGRHAAPAGGWAA